MLRPPRHGGDCPQGRIRGRQDQSWSDRPRDEVYRLQQARPLADHLADWHSYLTAKGSTRQHALLSRNRATRIIELARVERLSELAPSRIQAALKAIRDT